MNKKVNMSSISHKIQFIYGDECEKNKVGIIIYSNNGKLFFDSKFENPMTNEEVEALLLRGAVICKDGKFYRPTVFDNNDVNLENVGYAEGSDSIPKVFFTGTFPTTKDSVKMEMEYRSSNDNFTCWVDIKCQGTSSMRYDKKNFTVKLFEDQALENKYKHNFKKWGEQNKFCLKANWIDTTHTRNIASARIAYDMVDSRPDSEFKQHLSTAPRYGLIDGFPIKVYLNGVFHGIYTWNIPKDAWMFGMDEDNPNHIVLCAEINSDFNINVINSCQFRKPWNNQTDWKVEVGEYSEELVSKFNRVIDFVMNSSEEEFHDNISEYLDLYSLLDYYCFAYLCNHIDGLAKNMLMVTYDGVHWGASLYDMDSTFGSNVYGTGFYAAANPMHDGYMEAFSLLWQKFEKCFYNEIHARYFELRQHSLSLGNMVYHVENIYDLLSDRLLLDEKNKWTGLPSVDTNTISRFSEYISQRSKYVDDRINETIDGFNTGVRKIYLSTKTVSTPVDSVTNIRALMNPYYASDQEVTWSVDNKNVTVIANGLECSVTSPVEDSCVLTCTANDTDNGNISATCTITFVGSNLFDAEACYNTTDRTADAYKWYIFQGEPNTKYIMSSTLTVLERNFVFKITDVNYSTTIAWLGHTNDKVVAVSPVFTTDTNGNVAFALTSNDDETILNKLKTFTITKA